MSDRAHRDWLVDAHHTASQDFDKAIMTLAAGALGISITFIHEIAPKPTRHPWLAISWILLVASLLLVFISYLASQRVLEHEIGTRTPVAPEHRFRSTLRRDWRDPQDVERGEPGAGGRVCLRLLA